MPGFASNNLTKVVRQLSLLAFLTLLPRIGGTISANQLEDFQDGTSQWSVNNGSTLVPVAGDAGPAGNGDDALYMSTTAMGVSRLLVMNVIEWNGNWTAAGITQISLGVRNPNAFDLSMRLGIVGTGGQGSGGSGDTHVTDAITVAADNAWHELSFDVSAADFTPIGSYDPTAALAAVTHFRVIHSPDVSFIGADVFAMQGAFYLDNIRAIGSPASIPGDYNGNHVVDGADYAVWRKTLNQTGANLPADGTGAGGVPDGVVNGLDYSFWRARFGNLGSGSGTSVMPNAVPEPETWLIILGFSLFGCRKSRSRMKLGC
jgi:hypothetical protein